MSTFNEKKPEALEEAKLNAQVHDEQLNVDAEEQKSTELQDKVEEAKSDLNSTDSKETTLDNSSQTSSSSYDLDDEYETSKRIRMTRDEALALAKSQPGLSNAIKMVQVLVFLIFIAGFIGYVRGSTIEQHINYFEIYLNGTTEQKAELPSLESMLSEPLRELIAINPESYISVVKESLGEEKESLQNLAGPFSSLLSVGVVIWFMLSALAGGLSLIIPTVIYNMIARSRLQNATAFSTIYDVVRAEFLKYAGMALGLGFVFKLTPLNSKVAIIVFVAIMLFDLIYRSFAVSRMNDNKNKLEREFS